MSITRFYPILALAAALATGTAQAQNPGENVTSDFTAPKLNVLGQIWYFYQQRGAPEGETYSTFRIRRAEIALSGSINEWIRYRVMIDPARLPASTNLPAANVNILQDLFMEFSPLNWLRITVGQYKYPFTFEGLQSSGKLSFVERAELARIFGDSRQLGIMIGGELQTEQKRTFLGYQLGLFDGSSQNALDPNREKDLVARIYAKPVEELHLGAAAYIGRSSNLVNPQDRFGIEAVYNSDGLRVAAEAVTAMDSTDGPRAHQFMWNAAASYRVNSLIEPALRFEYDDNNAEISQSAAMLPGLQIGHLRATAGVNFYISEKTPTKIQVNYLWIKNGDFSRNPGQENNLLLVNTQFGF